MSLKSSYPPTQLDTKDEELPAYVPPDTFCDDPIHDPIPACRRGTYFSLTTIARRAGKSWAEIERIVREDLDCNHYTASYGKWLNTESERIKDLDYVWAAMGNEGFSQEDFEQKLIEWRRRVNAKASLS